MTTTSLHGGFQGTREHADTEAMLRWLEHADTQQDIQAIKREMDAAVTVEPGDRVLDVGCGVGLETQRLARRVGPSGMVVGVDVNEPMIELARERAAEEGGSIGYAVMDARRLDFADGCFDLCRAERVLRYIERPEAAIREMARVVRRGGQVVIFDFDSDATVVDLADRALARRVTWVLDESVPNCWMGRQLPRLFARAGLVDIAVHPQVYRFPELAVYQRLVSGTLEAAVRAGRLAADDLERLWDDLEEREQEYGFFGVNLGFVVSGRVG